ncbi:MAG: hypothetical protein AAB783_00585 [Patescibacteria group bacterium]
MFKVIYPRRWFVWTIVLSIITALLLMWAIVFYMIETQYGVDSFNAQFLDTFNRLHKKQSSNNIDTSSWLTYRNEKYGFELRYPNNLLVENEGKKFTNVENGCLRNAGLLPSCFSFHLIDRDGVYESYEDALSAEIEQSKDNPTVIRKSVYVDGRQAPAFYLDLDGEVDRTILLSLGKRFFRIHSWSSATSRGEGSYDDAKRNIPIFNTMLSTLKFFEPQKDKSQEIIEVARIFMRAHSSKDYADSTLLLEKEVDGWARVEVIPKAPNDRAWVILHIVNGSWEAVTIGTAFPDLWEKIPELFD